MRYNSLVENENNDADDVFEIHEQWMPELEKRIKQLNKRAAKIGARPVEIVVLDRFLKKVNEKLSFPYVRFRIEGEPPKVHGYKFLGTIDFATSSKPILRSVPGGDEEIPKSYRQATPTCDHCGKIRSRNEIFILKDQSNNYIQVGRNCLKDFLGHDPRNIAIAVRWLAEIQDYVEDLEEKEPSFGGGGGQWFFTIEIFLQLVAAAIRKYGWVSRSMSREYDDKIATATEALDELFAPQHKQTLHPTKEDKELAKNALDWCRNVLAQKDDLSNYEYNLVAVCEQDDIAPKNAGIAASLIVAYKRHMEEEIKRKQQSEQSEWQGVIGEKIERTVTVIKRSEYGSKYGVVGIHNMQDDEGNRYTWFASSSNWLEQGKKYRILGTVKKHDDFKGLKVTVLTRVKVIEELENGTS